MNSLFNDLKKGLEEAIDYEKGRGKAKTVTYIIKPVVRYNNTEIKSIREQAGMTQAVLANYMGVSKKTIEAWENGRIHPTGPACRLLFLLSEKETSTQSFVIRSEK